MLPSVAMEIDPTSSPLTTCGYVPALHAMDQMEKERLTVILLFPPMKAVGGIQIPPQQADWWFPRVQTPLYWAQLFNPVRPRSQSFRIADID